MGTTGQWGRGVAVGDREKGKHRGTQKVGKRKWRLRLRCSLITHLSAGYIPCLITHLVLNPKVEHLELSTLSITPVPTAIGKSA